MTDDTRNTLTFADRYKIAAIVQENTEPVGEGFCRYINGMSDQSVAEAATQAVGKTVTANNVRSVRADVAGNLREVRVRDNSLQAEVAALQAVVQGLAAKLDDLRKIIVHHDAKAHERRAACTAKMREIVGRTRVDERIMRTQMRGAGYTDDEISLSLYLAGAVVRQNGTGSTVELHR